MWVQKNTFRLFEIIYFIRYSTSTVGLLWPRPLGGQLVVTRLILHVANSCTKFSLYSCSRYRDISGNVKKIKTCHVTPTTPLSGMTCRQQAVTCYLLPFTYRPNLKFLTTPVRKIWKAVRNVEIGYSLGRLGVTQGLGNVTIRWSGCEFLFDFNRNCAPILYRFRDIASYLSKVADFTPPHLHLAPP